MNNLRGTIQAHEKAREVAVRNLTESLQRLERELAGHRTSLNRGNDPARMKLDKIFSGVSEVVEAHVRAAGVGAALTSLFTLAKG